MVFVGFGMVFVWFCRVKERCLGLLFWGNNVLKKTFCRVVVKELAFFGAVESQGFEKKCLVDLLFLLAMV